MAMKQQRDQSDLPNPNNNRLLCGFCGSSERWFLHHVRHRGVLKKLCTNCVLKVHADLFCPLCLELIGKPSPPPRDKVVCLKCHSVSHPACVKANSSLHGFQCPPCSSPSFSFFKLNRPNDVVSSGEVNGTGNGSLVIDKNSAKALVIAARIAADEMAGLAGTARRNAENRVKDAVVAKKRAREALENLTLVVNKQQHKEIDSKTGGGGRGVGGGGGGILFSTPESLTPKPPKLEAPGEIQLKTDHMEEE